MKMRWAVKRPEGVCQQIAAQLLDQESDECGDVTEALVELTGMLVASALKRLRSHGISCCLMPPVVCANHTCQLYVGGGDICKVAEPDTTLASMTYGLVVRRKAATRRL